MKFVLLLPSKDVLAERLNYDPETGKLFWKHAPRTMFKTDAGWRQFNHRRAGKEAGHKHLKKGGGRHAIIIRGKFGGVDSWFVAHRVIYALMGVDVPDAMEIDHKNRDPWDNRWENLRIATPSQNVVNRVGGKRESEESKKLPKGVSMQAGRYKAQISIRGERKRHIGMYATPEEAAEAYKAAAMPHHGEFFCQPTGRS